MLRSVLSALAYALPALAEAHATVLVACTTRPLAWQPKQAVDDQKLGDGSSRSW